MSFKKFKSKAAQIEDTSTEFDTIFQEHWSRIFTVVYRIVGDPAEAEDLALETFLQLYQNPPRAWTNIPGWLYRVATNLGLNALRARRRRGQYEIQAGTASLGRTAPPQPDWEVERAEDQQRVRQTLSKMKKRSAKILILRYSGLSYAEVAAAAGVSANSVGTLLARAEQEFKKRYREFEGGNHGE